MYGSKGVANNNGKAPPPPNPHRIHSFMTTEDVAAGKKSKWSELEITGPIRNLSPQLWQLQHLTSLYMSDNNLSRLPPEIVKLQHLVYLDLSSNKLRSLPAQLGELIHLRELLLHHNYIRVLPYELGKLFQLQTLGLTGNPLAPEFLGLYNEPSGTQKLLTYLFDNLNITSTEPPQRPWVPISHPQNNRPVAIFTVMCYNVLCDKYATRQLYGYCPQWALNWDYRKKAIMEDIRQYLADIISLQEVETEQFYSFFLPELKNEGYDGIFSPKSRAKTMACEDDRKHVDGCAIFFKTAKFALVKDYLVEFNQLAISTAEGSHDMINRVMTKDNIGLAALLETREGVWDNELPGEGAVRQPLLVATCHIHWDPEYSDVKLIQTMMLMSALKSIIEESQTSFRPGSSAPDCNALPLLLCGDLNSLPDSGVVDFLNTSKVPANHEDFKDLGYQDCLTKLSSCDDKENYSHSFRLSQAYSNDVMPYTNYTYEFKGIIDYIFYSRDFMRPLGVLGRLDQGWFEDNKVVGCPHPHIPSDHLPLLVEFEMAANGPISSTSSSNSSNTRPTATHSTTTRR